MKAAIVEKVAFNLLKQVVIYLPDDVKEALKNAYKSETSLVGKKQLETIIKNVEFAEKYRVPMCQDTGTIIFYVKAGANAKGLDKVEKALANAAKRATREIPLRPNAVNPFNNKNSGNNTGRFIPFVNWEIIAGDSIELTVMPKGGGSENVSTVGVLPPGDGLAALKKFVVDAVVKAGAQPCPPTVLGVAVGGGVDIAVNLAKKVLLRPLNKSNPNPKLAELEEELLEAVNMTGIGPMGLGGKTTVLKVHLEYAFRHPASFPVAVAFNCWAARRSSAKIHSNGTVDYLTHKAEA